MDSSLRHWPDGLFERRRRVGVSGSGQRVDHERSTGPRTSLTIHPQVEARAWRRGAQHPFSVRPICQSFVPWARAYSANGENFGPDEDHRGGRRPHRLRGRGRVAARARPGAVRNDLYGDGRGRWRGHACQLVDLPVSKMRLKRALRQQVVIGASRSASARLCSADRWVGA